MALEGTRVSNRQVDRAESLFRAVECQRFGGSTCFLCGRRLGSRNRTDEHVFPKWLLHRYRLWDKRVNLLNGTSIPYRQLTIPCCTVCNTTSLSTIEGAVQAAVESGLEAVRDLPPRTLFLWLAKIHYGMLFKEGLLLKSRRHPKGSRIVARQELATIEMLHYFLQASRLPLRFEGFFPASLFVFEVQLPDEVEYQWDYRDHPDCQAISLRMGNIGILAALMDGGAHQEVSGDYLATFQAMSLHPLQFLELSASFLYKSELFECNPKYVMIGGAEEIAVMQLPLGGFSARPLYREWHHRHYAQVLAFHTRFPFDRLYHASSGAVMSWLRDDNGEIPRFSLTEQPWPTAFPDDEMISRMKPPNTEASQ